MVPRSPKLDIKIESYNYFTERLLVVEGLSSANFGILQERTVEVPVERVIKSLTKKHVYNVLLGVCFIKLK